MEKMSCGKLVDKEDLDVVRPARCEQRMLRNPDQGERDGASSDCMAHHIGRLVTPLPVTPWGDRSLLRFN